MAGDLLEL